MKLNINNILDWLRRKKIRFSTSLTSDLIEVDCVKWFSNDKNLREALQVVMDRTGAEDTVVIVEGGTIIVFDESSEAVFSEFLMMFRYYNEIESQALRAVFYEQSISQIVDVASRLFSGPVIIESEEGKLIAGCERDQVIARSVPKDAILSFDLSEVYLMAQKEISLPDTINPAHQPYQLCSSIWLANNKVGRIVVCRYTDSITHGTIHLLKWLTLVVERLVALSSQSYYQISSVSQKLHMMLINQEDNAVEVERSLNKINWHTDDRYIFLIAAGFTNTDDMDTMTAQIRTCCREFRCLYHYDRLILLGNLSYEKDFVQSVYNAVQNSSLPLRICKSYPFYGWNNLSRFCHQAKEIADYIEQTGRGEISTQEFSVHYIKESVRATQSLRCLEHPDYTALRFYDEQNGSSYLSDLQTYLLTGCRINLTSERLGIHSNTLRYRIRKIEELISGNLYDANYRKELIYAALLV